MVSSTGLNHLISFYKKVQVHFGQNNQNKTAENLEVIPWTYKTKIPHQSFFAKYRGETFCEGFVFSIEDLNMDNQEVL